MTNYFRIVTLAGAAAFALTAGSAIAAPTSVSNGPVQAHAEIRKPLTLTKDSDLNFGIITVQDTGDATIDGTGAISCTGGLTCAGTGTAAQYTVTGTNNQVVTISKPPVVLTNTDPLQGGTPLTLTLSGPASVTLPNSGATGIQFELGGTMNVPASTKEGTYQGDLAVTVNY